MSTLGERIKTAREKLNISQAELANEINIKPSSGVISNWERDLNKPDAEKIIKLCNVLKISASYLLDYYGSLEFECTLNEKDHIKKYRSLSEYDKVTVDSLLDRLSDRRTEQAKEFINIEPPLLIPYYGKVASAGTGQYIFNDIPPEMIEIENNIDNLQASFAIGVNGNSMEPTYKDGDTVLVKKQDKINIGEIGIFMIDGEAFVKELGNGVLISHNKSYDDIKITLDTQCLGKVINVKEE